MWRPDPHPLLPGVELTCLPAVGLGSLRAAARRELAGRPGGGRKCAAGVFQTV